jgi:sulfate adenylyltransferase subunit 2
MATVEFGSAKLFEPGMRTDVTNKVFGASLPAHLCALEAEAIAGNWGRLWQPYSALLDQQEFNGSPSSIRKTFHPASISFALLHIDTTWKFREMVAFRDATAAR